MNIIDHGIGNYVHSEVYIDKPEEVLQDIISKQDEILDKANDEMQVRLNPRNDSHISGVECFDNGIMLHINNTIPSAANMYDDFSSARMYLFDDGEVHYLFDKLDTRIKENKDSENINKDIISELDNKLGNKKEFDVIKFSNMMDSLERENTLTQGRTL